MIEIHYLATVSGHNKITFEDDPEKRGELAEHVIALIRKGHAIFLEQEDGSTPRVRGYDAVDNTWIIADITAPAKKKGKRGPKSGTKKVSAKSTRATIVPARAGG